MPNLCDAMLLEMQSLRFEENDRKRYDAAIAECALRGLDCDEYEIDPRDMIEDDDHRQMMRREEEEMAQ